MADKLTPQQQLAVDNRGGRLLVSAAAGSGKTKVLVDRLMKYLTDPEDPANLDEFLIITYTKAAAAELRGKIAAKLTERIAENPDNRLHQQMQRLYLTKISTVHGFCADLLREYAYKLDIPGDFRVADENECLEIREQVLESILDRAYEHIHEDPDLRAFVDTQGVGRNDRLVPEILMKVYDSAVCHLDPEGWLDSCLNAADLSEVTDAARTVWGQYLMEQLWECADSHIRMLQRCEADALRCDGFDKVAANIRETLAVVREIRACETWDEVVARKKLSFPRFPTIRNCTDPDLKDAIKIAREACKEALEDKLKPFSNASAQVLEDLRQTASGTRGIISLMKQFMQEYALAKRSRHVLDFSDLEQRTLDLLVGRQRTTPTAVAGEIGARFREIMVDEYQDSNAVQDKIFSALTEKRQNCFMVGDVKQSIYQFRQADPEIFLRKYQAYAAAEEAQAGEGRKVLLSHNFRSGGEVIDAVNDVFRVCMSPAVGGLYYGNEEKLREGIPHENLPDSAVELYAIQASEARYMEEAEFVAGKICRMLENGTPIRGKEGFRPVQPEDIVILLRSPGSVGHTFQRALEKKGIRCTSGGGIDLLKTREIETLRSLLMTIYNPRQDIPLISTLASPVFGFTADDLAAFRSARRGGTVYDALLRDESPKTTAFLQTLETLRREARMNSLTELLESCFRLTRMDSIFAAMDDGEVKCANLRLFFQLAADYELGSHRDLGQFLDHLAALEAKGLKTAGSSGGGAVSIMSIHKSKGLEFPVVFLCGLGRKFNKDSLKARILCDKELGLGLSVADAAHRLRYPTISRFAIAAKINKESISEELRVLYVAMTRARDRLIMTCMSQNLEKKLKTLAMRMDYDGDGLLSRDAKNPGDWILRTALEKTEAGELFRYGAKPRETKISASPWKIRAIEAVEEDASSVESEELVRKMPDGAEELLQSALAFRYQHVAATQTPSKQTATGRKGRMKDEEAAEDTAEPKQIHRSWRSPSFLDGELQGKQYGNAVHSALQYIRYENCGSADAVREEIHRLTEGGFLTQQQGDAVDCEEIAAFFASEIGTKLRCGGEHLREFKFSILDAGSKYGDHLEGEQVLLQGVVDCALLEEDGITIVDFKTDHVTEDTLQDSVKRYTDQVLTYGEALSRIYEMPVKKRYLYFFRLGRFVEV